MAAETVVYALIQTLVIVSLVSKELIVDRVSKNISIKYGYNNINRFEGSELDIWFAINVIGGPRKYKKLYTYLLFKRTIQVLRHHVFDFFMPTHILDDLQYCKSSKTAIFWPHPPTSLMT